MPGQSIIGGLSNINLAADLAAGAGLDMAEAACYDQKRVWRAFAAADYGDFRYKHRGSLDSRVFTFLTGLAYSPSDNLILGAFFEFGHSNFDSRNRADGRSIRGDGDATHTGGGLLARWSDIGGTGLHLSGSVRAGYIRGDFDSGDLVGARVAGDRTGFTTKGAYLGAHVGLGYRLDLTNCLKLDLDTKYLWSRAPGEDVTLFGERVRLENLNSHRVKTGGKFIWKATNRVRPYAGGWYEYEFDGKAKSRSITTGQAFRSSELKGSTGIGELGVEFRPYGEVDCPRALIDLSVSGHVGRRKGVSGQARFQWMF